MIKKHQHSPNIRNLLLLCTCLFSYKLNYIFYIYKLYITAKCIQNIWFLVTYPIILVIMNSISNINNNILWLILTILLLIFILYYISKSENNCNNKYITFFFLFDLIIASKIMFINFNITIVLYLKI